MEATNIKLMSKALVSKMLICVAEYEAIKNKTSSRFKNVKDFYAYYQFSSHNFLKMYNRYKQNPDPLMLLPQKRGLYSNQTNVDTTVENKVLELRALSLNCHEIASALKKEGIEIEATTIYNVLQNNDLNKLSQLSNNKNKAKAKQSHKK